MHYRPGKANVNADALSCGAITQTDDLIATWIVMAAVQADIQPAKEGEEKTLSHRHMADPEISEIRNFRKVAFF